MLFLNVSFGLFAFLPEGWLFMAFVITMEAFIMSFFLSRKKFEKRISIATTTSNIISGIIGIMASLLLNGGWWLVVWFPWVSSHEVKVHNTTELTGLLIYYVVAMILSVLIEMLINHLILRTRYSFKSTFKATLIANASSYVLGAVLIAYFCL